LTLVDASVLVALLNVKDRNYDRSWHTLGVAATPYLTTWACITEALHLLGKYGGWTYQNDLLGFFDDGFIELHLGSQPERIRIRTLMAKYSDSPMDFADASLVAAAEALGVSTIFTLDRHFYAYLLNGKDPITVIP
jgi:predicted nucleic acid-binding protein